MCHPGGAPNNLFGTLPFLGRARKESPPAAEIDGLLRCGHQFIVHTSDWKAFPAFELLVPSSLFVLNS
jgi:hypothetical protein